MIVKDFILGGDDDIQIKDGDFVVDESDAQHIQHIIMSSPGDWKQFPFIGLDTIAHINAPETDIDKLRKYIKLQLQSDGYNVEEISINSFEDINIKAERNT